MQEDFFCCFCFSKREQGGVCKSAIHSFPKTIVINNSFTCLRVNKSSNSFSASNVFNIYIYIFRLLWVFFFKFFLNFFLQWPFQLKWCLQAMYWASWTRRGSWFTCISCKIYSTVDSTVVLVQRRRWTRVFLESRVFF